MSKIALQGDAAGTGTLTIASPNTNTNRTLTLPDASGTVALQGGAGVGKVLQVVSSTSSTQFTTSSTTPQMAMGVSITPTSSSSKILVVMSLAGWVQNTGSNAARIIMAGISRNAGTPFFSSRVSTTQSATTDFYPSISLSYLDSPSSTSSTTYYATVAILGSVYGGTVGLNYDTGQTSTITLMEIAA